MLKRILFACLSVALLCVNVNALTVSQIYSEVRRYINDNPTSSDRYRYSDSTLNSFINNAQKEIVNATWLSQNTSSYVLSPGTTYYSLPSDMIAIAKVEFQDKRGNITELKESTLKKLYGENVDWKQNSGAPVEYYVSEANISSPSLSNLNISYLPIPTLTSTGTVVLQYYNQVVDVSTGTNIPFDSKSHLVPYHNTIVYNVVAKIKLLEMKITESQYYEQLYGRELIMMRDRIHSKPNYNPSMTVAPR